MISAEKVMKVKVIELIKIYNFYFGHFSVGLCLNNSNFELLKQTHMEKGPKPKLWILMSSTTLLLTAFSFQIIFDILEFNTFLLAKEKKK